MVDPGAALEAPLIGMAPEVDGEVIPVLRPELLAFLPVNFGDVASFSARKKSFLSIKGLDFPLPSGSRSPKRPPALLESFADPPTLICCGAGCN